jgi:CheY-like chemotaxis protein
MPTESRRDVTMRKPRILVVEDEVVVAMDIQMQLVVMGFDVTATEFTGEGGVRKAAELKPDLVLMDIQLRGKMDGVEAAERIWSNCRIPVIYVTAHYDERTANRAKGTEHFGFLLKPFSGRQLRVLIRAALADTANTAPLPAPRRGL